MATLQADADQQVLLLGFNRGQEAADARCVGGNWLLAEDVLALANGVLELLRLKAGGVAITTTSQSTSMAFL